MFRRRVQGFSGALIRAGATAFGHRFGGGHAISGATCVNCRKPLLNYLRVDRADPVLRGWDGRLDVPLLYCMRCALCWYDFSYAVQPRNAVAVLKAHEGEVDDEEWYSELGDAFEPQPVQLVPIPAEFAGLVKKVREQVDLSPDEERRWNQYLGRRTDASVDAFCQFGGEPYLLQHIDDPDCPRCEAGMSFIACFYNDPVAGVKVAPEGLAAQVSFFGCAKCGVVTVLHRI